MEKQPEKQPDPELSDVSNNKHEELGGSPSPQLGHAKEFVDPDAHLSEKERAEIDRKLVWKLDMKLIPWLTLLYLASFLDRTNIGNAKIEGLQEDLRMTNSQYNAALTIFFVSYAVFEPLTNILLKRFRPSIFIPTIMVLWGICMTLMGVVNNYGGLMATRWFLGLTEAGLFPGVSYFLSCWYKRSEFGVRIALFFSAAAVAGSFGGLLAAAIAQMDTIGNRPGWAWIFILEGLATVLLGVISYWLVQDFPDEATFLSEDDRNRVLRRLALDKQSSAEHEEFKMEYVYAALKDWKTYLSALIFAGTVEPLYAFSLFLPTIIRDLVSTPLIIIVFIVRLTSYKSTTAQLLSVPPYAVAACLTIAVGFYADRTRHRGMSNVCVSVLAIIGFSMLLGADNARLRYAGTFLGAMGIYPTISNTVSWVGNNTEGVYKRGIAIGFVVGFGNLNGVVSSNIFRGKDAPNYYPGHGTILAYLVLFVFGGSLLQHILLRIENGKRLRGERDHWIEGLDAEAIDKLGDRRPDFLYTL
ncbi:hypothetical protein FQN57_004581 [Myotisia sp. PD_48]|nr:hypothetical protein FQN57_004581 [Myotisia sp. PD_48]